MGKREGGGGLGVLGGDRRWGLEERRATALQSVTHNSAQLGRWKEVKRTGRDRDGWK